MPNNFIWNGEAIKRKIEAETMRRLDASAIAVENHARKLISVEGTTQSKPGGKLSYNKSPSAPGEPPHVQTGQLRGSVAHERTGMIARVGTNLKKGRALELGTSKMAARPWLRRALAEMTPFIRAVFVRPIK